MAAQGFRDLIQAATVYVEGRSFVGEAAEVTLPNIEMVQQDYRAMGMPSATRRFTGFAPLEATLVFDSINKAVLTQVGFNNIREKNFQVRYVTGSSDGSTKHGVCEFSGRANMVERGAISTGEEAVQTTLTVQCISYKETFDGEEVYDIDTEKQSFKVGGEELWADFAAGL